MRKSDVKKGQWVRYQDESIEITGKITYAADNLIEIGDSFDFGLTLYPDRKHHRKLEKANPPSWPKKKGKGK